MTKPKPKSKLSALGDSAEVLLSGIMKEMKSDLKRPADKKPGDGGRRYSLTDQMRVLDRVAKFEAIRAKMGEDEGEFFDQPPEEEEPDNSDDGGEDDGSGSD